LTFAVLSRRLRPNGRQAVPVIDTRIIYCRDNLEQLKKLPPACVDVIYIDPPFNSNRNYEVWGTKISL
jgi:16S rRNA G966 N2-methylase RsmD